MNNKPKHPYRFYIKKLMLEKFPLLEDQQSFKESITALTGMSRKTLDLKINARLESEEVFDPYVFKTIADLLGVTMDQLINPELLPSQVLEKEQIIS